MDAMLINWLITFFIVMTSMLIIRLADSKDD